MAETPNQSVPVGEKPPPMQKPGEAVTKPERPQTRPLLTEKPTPTPIDVNPASPTEAPEATPQGNEGTPPSPTPSASPETPLIPKPVTPGDPNATGKAATPEEIAKQNAGRGFAGTQRKIFKLTGREAWAVAAQRGWKFGPRGAQGACDGQNTSYQLMPGLTISVTNGPVMRQLRTPPQWNVMSQNVFYMFSDQMGRPMPLAEGWSLKDLTVRGKNWRWVEQPKTGARSPYFAIEIVGKKGPQQWSQAELTELILEGPSNATDWKSAFTPVPRPVTADRRRRR